MESNLTITIFSEEYRDLIKSKCNYEILLGLLIDCAELDYRDKLRLNGSQAADYIEQFAPMAYELKLKELLSKKGE